MQLNRRSLITSGLLGSAFVGQTLIRSKPHTAPLHFSLETAVPTVIGAWRAVESPYIVAPDLNELKGVKAAYESVVMRSYAAQSRNNIMLIIAHGRPDSGLLSVHRPEVCYKAQGFTVQSEGVGTLEHPFEKINPKKLFAVNGEREEAILYWVTIGGRQTDAGIEQKIGLIGAAWEGVSLDAFLVRVSSISGNSSSIYRELERFGSEMLISVPPALRNGLA